MIKLIVSDMDGTLIGDKMGISHKNKEAIVFAKSKGIPFAIATGRHLNEALPELQAAGLSCPLITANGSAVYDAQQQLTTVFAIPQNLVQIILKIVRQFNDEIAIELTTVESVVTDNLEKRLLMLKRFVKNHLPNASQDALEVAYQELLDTLSISVIDSLEQLVETSDDNSILKFFITTLNDVDVLARLKVALAHIPDIIITSSHPTNIEINSIHATKGAAVEALSQQLNIRMENVMALGDNFNDSSMIERVGYGIAMENAVQHIKNIAKYTTLSNLDDGVAHAIYHFIQ